MYIAHKNQSLKEHLEGVARLCRINADKIGCGSYGEILGLLHDLGKYSQEFQSYIKSALGLLDPDTDDNFVDVGSRKGKIDHSTAGAQYLWKLKASGTQSDNILAQMLSLCLVSHHSGIIDCLTTDDNGTSDSYTKRICKSDTKTHLTEAMGVFEVLDRLNHLLSNPDLTRPIEVTLRSILSNAPEKTHRSIVFQFQLGLLVRFLFSCLIDADRQDSADSEKPGLATYRQNGAYQDWVTLIQKLDTKLAEFGSPQTPVNVLRTEVSDACLKAAQKDKGPFSLTVPTGGGKTLASLRFALHHAEKYKLDRIIYIVPFTSIIDQNADEIRKVLETDPADKGQIVLEHHSNIGADVQSWKEKLLTENWDAPVVLTTMVQFLEALFGSGTKGARRMHQLANSVIIFDEIQSLPIRCTHMFCNAVNFLINQCGSSVVLCTATQPLLGRVDPKKGSLQVPPGNEIIPNVQKTFDGLKRVEVIDSRRASGWSDIEISSLAAQEVTKTGSCLIVVNKKGSARDLFKVIESTGFSCYHLSTSMCPAHRKFVLAKVKGQLSEGLPTICVSTQLIEAGVDIDFGSVIRFSAGLDSIAQAAGRCNRSGSRAVGRVYIVNPVDENLTTYLADIAIGKARTERVLQDYLANPGKYQNDRIGPSLLTWYYKDYFFNRASDMGYKADYAGRGTSLLNMLSLNSNAVNDFQSIHKKAPDFWLRQSFMSASRLFKAIDAPTKSVIVPYGDDGMAVIKELCTPFDPARQFGLLRKAQPYTVVLFPKQFEKLEELGALIRVQDETEIFYLNPDHYSEKFGVSIKSINGTEV